MYQSPYAGSGAGAGGKIRRGRPPTRAASTPYERPPAAAAAHRLAAAAAAASASSGPGGEGVGGSGGWMSRLVDPASRLIAGGAARLFGSVFRKRLAPPPAPSPQLLSPPGRNNDPTQDLPDSTNVDSPPLPEGGVDKGKNIAATSDDKALSEVEHLLMRKTFTRVEFDRLTDLLRARTIEPDPPTSIVSREEKNEGIRIDGIGGSASHQMAAYESPTVKVHSHGASSPAELAKQYMSSRYSREPQSSSLRSRLFLENKGEASNPAYDRSGPRIVQAPMESGNQNPGLPVNGYVTSGLRGRSAIYRMSRSPYFKAPSSIDVNTSSFSQRAQNLHVGGRQVLKRRGGDLENEVGSIGPIRRIQQKSNMMSSFRDDRAIPRGNLLTSRTSGSDFMEDSTSIQESPSSKRLLLGTSGRPLESHKNGDGKPSDNTPPIPAKSNKMAEKIFEQLNIIAPSPKEKQSGQQSVTGNASNSMSKKAILQDTGPSSMHDPSSSLKFQDLDRPNGPLDPDLNGSLLKKDKLNMIKDESSKVALSDKPTLLGNSKSASTSRKPGFKMAVMEDLPELDDDLEVPVPSKSQSKIEVETIEQKSDSTRKEQKIEQNILEQKVESNLTKKSIVGCPVTEQPVASVSKTATSSGGLLSSNVPGKAVPNASVDDNAGFAFPNASPGTRLATSVSATLLASVNDDKQTGASNSIFGFKQSITSDLETPNARSKSTPGQSVGKLPALDHTSSERSDKTEKTEDVTKSSDKVLPSAASTTLNAPFHFASAASTSASLSNGFSHSSSPTLGTVPPTDKPAVSGSGASTLFAVSSSSPAISSSSSPAFTAAFKFPSSASVGLSAVPSAKSDGTTTEVKPANTMSFGIGGATDEAKSTAPDSASKQSSKPAPPISSSPITSVPIFSPVAASSDAAGSVTAAPSNTSTDAPGVQAASTASITVPSSGNSPFGFSLPAQSTGLSTSSIAGSTSQLSAASTLFGSKPAESVGTIQQPSQSPKPQFGSPFPSATPGVGASSGSGTLSFGIGASSTGSGTMSFGVGASSSTPGTSSAFGIATPSSGPGIFSFAAGTSSSGSGTVTFGVGAASSGPGTMSFGAPAASSGPGTMSFGAGTSSSGSESVPFGVGAASSGPGTLSFGAGAASSGPGAVSFGAGTSSSGPGTVSFGATTSTSGSAFGASPFGAGGTFANPFSSGSSAGFTFSSASSSAVASTVASTSMNSTPQPAFGMTNTNTVFGMSSPGNDQMNEDSMADDTNQAAPAQAPAPIFGSPFGQQNSAPAAPAFGAPAVQPGGAFQFGSQQQAAQQNPSFPATGSLEFQGGNFSLGSTGGGDKSSRRIFKAKRTTKKR
ncbi:unnamed protein product [Urochloa humidicola]